MIVTITEDAVGLRDGHDLTRLHVESATAGRAADAERLEAAGLGHVREDGDVLLDVAVLHRLVSTTVEADLHTAWQGMLSYAARKGWTDPDRRFLRAHVERVPEDRADPLLPESTGPEPITAEPIPPDRFRAVLGHYASGVTVITGAAADGPVGFSCQSFSALSLDPPLVLILPGKGSTSWPKIQATGRFCVNVLAAEQEALCAGFARSGGDKFAGVEHTPGTLGAPRLAGACAWIDCEIGTVSEGGDHLVVLGRVHALDADPAKAPLIFHKGQYGKLA
ncbi:flavin reductase family protein [Amycolatopsis rhabdoformis]|uniref:Flavin reductase family protein n=1 Tax=Amycolatopsis rhabdoformis TaxID=1448059 RepID=A0ABZ1IEI6_9PSEU|nr:flavin reductase family protein [Amycolatopsis rhabdoformis]WSE32499.1 flavin reductase family protein [Amycolatopsis rhabdoformis]